MVKICAHISEIRMEKKKYEVRRVLDKNQATIERTRKKQHQQRRAECKLSIRHLQYTDKRHIANNIYTVRDQCIIFHICCPF